MVNAKFPCAGRRWLVIALLLCWAGTAARADTQLRWKFKRGDTLHYEITQKSDIASKVAGRDDSLQVGQVLNVTWKVDSVEGDRATITQTFDRIRLTLDGTGGGRKIHNEFDSKDAQEPTEPQAKKMSETVRSLIGEGFTFTMNSRGDVSDIKLSNKLTAALGGGGAAAGGGMFTAERIKSTFKQTTLILPREAVKQGSQWSDTVTAPSPLGTVKLANTYTYKGTKTQGGGNVDVIDVASTMEFQLPEGAPAEVKLKSQDVKGQCLFDNESGRLQSSTTNQQFTLQLSAQGMQIEQNVNTTVSMKLVPSTSRS